MLDVIVTSSVRSNALGRVDRCDILEFSRAVAKTWRLYFWNDSTRAEPMPPAMQPVMRTVLRAMVMMPGLH